MIARGAPPHWMLRASYRGITCCHAVAGRQTPRSSLPKGADVHAVAVQIVEDGLPDGARLLGRIPGILVGRFGPVPRVAADRRPLSERAQPWMNGDNIPACGDQVTHLV